MLNSVNLLLKPSISKGKFWLGFFFPLEDPTTQGSGFSTVNLVSKFFFSSVLTD